MGVGERNLMGGLAKIPASFADAWRSQTRGFRCPENVEIE